MKPSEAGLFTVLFRKRGKKKKRGKEVSLRPSSCKGKKKKEKKGPILS